MLFPIVVNRSDDVKYCDGDTCGVSILRSRGFDIVDDADEGDTFPVTDNAVISIPIAAETQAKSFNWLFSTFEMRFGIKLLFAPL